MTEAMREMMKLLGMTEAEYYERLSELLPPVIVTTAGANMEVN